MATRNIVPRANGEGSLGTSEKKWGSVYAGDATFSGTVTLVTPEAADDSTKPATTAFVKDQVASETVAGMVELATSAETLTGTDTVRAVTPKALADTAFYRKGNILGTVSQSGGVPTGAVIERGSNANGEYAKFADGTMICTATKTIYYNTNQHQVFLYPSEFLVNTKPALSVSHAYEYSEALLRAKAVTIHSVTNTSYTLLYHPIGTTLTNYDITADIYILAIGRWF